MVESSNPVLIDNQNMLFIRPRDCHYCGNGFYGLSHAVEYAQSKNKWGVTDLNTTDAEKTPVLDGLSQKDPLGLYGFGHGNPSVFTGNSETAIFSAGDDLSILNGRVVYLLSCLTAQQLGQAIVNSGAKAYAGFMQEWQWVIAGTTDDDPYLDEIGLGFFESANELWKAMIDGATLRQALTASIAKYNQWIDHWFEIGGPYISEIIGALAHDRDILMAYGDLNASLEIGADDMEQYKTKEECEANNGIWWSNGVCHSYAEFSGDSSKASFDIMQYLPWILAAGAIATAAYFIYTLR